MCPRKCHLSGKHSTARMHLETASSASDSKPCAGLPTNIALGPSYSSLISFMQSQKKKTNFSWREAELLMVLHIYYNS